MSLDQAVVWISIPGTSRCGLSIKSNTKKMVKGLTTYLVEPDHGMWASRRKPEAPNFARRVKCAKKWGRTASSKSPGSTTRRWGKETNTAQIDLEIRHLAYPAHQQPQAADESRVPPLFQSRTENPRINHNPQPRPRWPAAIWIPTS
jgi:hypothetical protein